MSARIHTLRLIAHYELALGAEERILDLKGFAAAWVKSLSGPEKKLLSRYIKGRGQIARDLAAMMEAGAEAAKKGGSR
jgi:ParB-like chromosome segregation protein Spo0J